MQPDPVAPGRRAVDGQGRALVIAVVSAWGYRRVDRSCSCEHDLICPLHVRASRAPLRVDSSPMPGRRRRRPRFTWNEPARSAALTVVRGDSGPRCIAPWPGCRVGLLPGGERVWGDHRASTDPSEPDPESLLAGVSGGCSEGRRGRDTRRLSRASPQRSSACGLNTGAAGARSGPSRWCVLRGPSPPVSAAAVARSAGMLRQARPRDRARDRRPRCSGP